MLVPSHHPQSAAERGAAVMDGRPRLRASPDIASAHPPMEQRISALQRIELGLRVSSAPVT